MVFVAELEVGIARFVTQAFVLVSDSGGNPVSLSMGKGHGETLIELLVSLGASEIRSPGGKTVAQSGSAAWNDNSR